MQNAQLTENIPSKMNLYTTRYEFKLLEFDHTQWPTWVSHCTEFIIFISRSPNTTVNIINRNYTVRVMSNISLT